MKTPLRIVTIVIAGSLLLGLTAWLAGAFHNKIEATKLPIPTPPVSGELHQVVSVIEDTRESATGAISSRDETTVSARIMATIQRVTVHAGAEVKQGDLLLELDDRDLKSRVAQADQSVIAARALLEEVRSEFDRIKPLYERQLASRSEFDRVTAALRSRNADHQRNQRQLEEAKNALSFTVIKSPIAGKVIERYAEAGDTAAPGIPLLKIYNPSLLRLDAQVRESLAANMSVGASMTARIDALDREVPVVIDEIVPASDPGSRSITVKALLPVDTALYPGMFGRLIIPTGKTERIYIPTSAISRMGQLEFVQVLQTGKSVKRYIRTGHTTELGQTEVLSGLRVGETIIMPVQQSDVAGRKLLSGADM